MKKFCTKYLPDFSCHVKDTSRISLLFFAKKNTLCANFWYLVFHSSYSQVSWFFICEKANFLYCIVLLAFFLQNLGLFSKFWREKNLLSYVLRISMRIQTIFSWMKIQKIAKKCQGHLTFGGFSDAWLIFFLSLGVCAKKIISDSWPRFQ